MYVSLKHKYDQELAYYMDHRTPDDIAAEQKSKKKDKRKDKKKVLFQVFLSRRLQL